MKRKCKVCFKGNLNANGECDNCGATEPTKKEKSGQNLFYGRCEICGGDGRLIENGEGRGKVAYYRCYDCFCKEYNRERINRSQTNNCPPPVMEHGTKEYQEYLAAIDEYFNKPRWYNRQPNELMIRKASWELLKSQVKVDVKTVMQAFEDKKISAIMYKAV